MESSSPVYTAINNIISLFDLEDATALSSYKNEKDFNNIWRLLAFTPPELDQLSKTFIIVWDGIPARNSQSDAVNTSKYLTPVDWAVGLSLAVYNLKEKKNEPSKDFAWPALKILILDVTSNLNSESDSLKIINQFPRRSMKNLPWVRIFSPGDSTSNWTIEKFFNTIIGTEADTVPSMNDAFEMETPDLDILRHMWTSILTRPSTPDEHHALANLVGPLLLTKAANDNSHVNALSSLMRAIGLLSQRKEDDAALLTLDSPWIKWNENPWKDKLSRLTQDGKKLNVILVDDQYDQGWERVLGMALSVEWNANVIVKAFNSAEKLIETLSGQDQRFRFSYVAEKNKETPDILFLDLRLYSNRTEQDEADFFKKMIPLASKLKDDGVNRLPWKGFTTAEIEKVEKWITDIDKRKRGDDDYRVALTFLPRIISLIDLSLPIIIFSSTGRHDIMEELKHYANIITVFDKPRFTVDTPLDIAGQTKRKFQQAMEKAINTLLARQKCRVIKTYKDYAARLTKDDKAIHVEVFVDETFADRKNQVYVGGCFAAFSADTKEKAIEKANNFDDDLVVNGIRYFQSFGIGSQPLYELKEKKADISVEFNEIVQKSFNKPDHIGVIRLGYRLPEEHGSFDLFNPYSADNLYRLTLTALIEIFLSESLPALFGAKAAEYVSISIYAGTRVKDYENDADERLALREAKYHFGLESFEGKDQHGRTKDLLKSVSRDSIYPIVTHILSANKLKRSIERVVGIKLAYEDSKGSCPRFPSYFVCRTCKEIQTIDAQIGGSVIELNKTILNVATVSNISPERAYGFIRSLENGVSAFVHKTEWKDMEHGQKNDLVIYSQLESGAKGMVAKGVRLLTEDEKKIYENAKKEYSLADSVDIKCSCDIRGRFVPDYRALHYVADEVLNHIGDIKRNTGLGQSIKYTPASFDDMLSDDNDLNATINACRCLNQNDIVGAIAEIRLDNASLGRYQVKPKILSRIATHMDALNGKDFSRITARINGA